MLAVAVIAFAAGLSVVGSASRPGRGAQTETVASREWNALVTPHGPDR
jgi:hypothetical protein